MSPSGREEVCGIAPTLSQDRQKCRQCFWSFYSHQNFADMRYGLDPNFRFTISRAIYKGILKYLNVTQNKQYVVQPLPVKGFSANVTDNRVNLNWLPVNDTLEPTAKLPSI